MVQNIITPWRSHAELLRVRKALYPNQFPSSSSTASQIRPSNSTNNDQNHNVPLNTKHSSTLNSQLPDSIQNGDGDANGVEKRKEEGKRREDEIKEAVARVAVWVQRGNCPHLVESTAILWSAVLNDGAMGGELEGGSRYCVRAAYAAAFCRFVTGLLDSHQDKRRKLSMYSIAKTLNLPATYVELRHQATHEELPSLSKLRTATQKALKWIWDYYWIHLKDDPLSIVDGSRVYIEQMLRETDADVRERMEDFVGKWEEDRLMGVLVEIQGEGCDVALLGRASRLQVLLGEKGSRKKRKLQEVEADVKQEIEERDLEALKEEMEMMNQELERERDKEPNGNVVAEEVKMQVVDDSKGWTMWQGPWIPKPIGVV